MRVDHRFWLASLIPGLLFYTAIAEADVSDEELAALEARVAKLEQRLNAPLTVRAPFAVVGKDGHPIAQIASGEGGGGNLLIYGSDRSEAISLLTLKDGTVVNLDEGEKSVRLLAAKTGTGVRVMEGKKEAAFFGRLKDGSTTVTVNNPNGMPVAGLGGDETGGALEILHSDAKTRAVALSADANGGKVSVFGSKGGQATAELRGDTAKGALTLYTSSGEVAGTLYSTTSGASVLELSNAAGQIVVEAGSDGGSGVGVVQTGPAGGLGDMGRPPSFIKGRKEGK